MKKSWAIVAVLVLGISLTLPALALAQELPVTPDVLPPAGLVTFGLLGLLGGSLGYRWRQRKAAVSRDPEQAGEAGTD